MRCGYADLEIQEGGQASLEYLRVHFGSVPEEERRKVRGQLERYCGQDTGGMVWIVEAFCQLALWRDGSERSTLLAERKLFTASRSKRN